MVQFKKKKHGYGHPVKFSNEEIDDMDKTVKALENSDMLMKRFTETLQNDLKKGGALPMLPMLFGTLGVTLLSGRGMYSAGSGGNNKCNCGKGMHRAAEGLFRAGQGIRKKS